MLELPESVTIAKEMTTYLRGKVISKVEVGHSPHRFAFYKGEKEKYDEMLTGQEVIEGTWRGGLVELDTKEYMIYFGDGAYPRIYSSKNKMPKKRQFAIYFEDGSVLSVSIQMYGEIGVFLKGECDDLHYISSKSKPDPCSDEFTYGYFKSLYPVSNKMSAKAFLATEQRIPGLGNGVLQDILWNAGIDPRFSMAQMDEEGFYTLYKAVKETLHQMRDKGGRDTEKDFFGNPGGYITQMSKNSLFEPCMKCGSEIHKATYMGGTIYYCENCQRR